jgi:ferrous iron transport protein B
VEYQAALEHAIAGLAPRLEEAAKASGTSARWLAVRLLEGDDLARQVAGPDLAHDARQRAESLGDDIDILVADARYGLANHIANAGGESQRPGGRDLTDRIDRVVLNRTLGIPIFLVMMYLMFMFTINIGGAFIDFFDQFAGAYSWTASPPPWPAWARRNGSRCCWPRASAAACRPWPPSSR